MLQNHVLTSRTSDFETFHYSETREKNMKFLSGCLGYQKFWYHEYILIIRGSIPSCWIPSCIVCGSKILNLLRCLGDQNFWLSHVFWGSEILNPLLCCLGAQKFWISCVVLGSEILNPLLCYLEDQKLWIPSSVFVGNFLGNQTFWFHSCGVWEIRNFECSPVFL